MSTTNRHPHSPRHHESLCRCGESSYAAVHAPDDAEYARRIRHARTVARPARQVARPAYRPTKCRNCGFDIKGLYGSDRQAHKDGWCGE